MNIPHILRLFAWTIGAALVPILFEIGIIGSSPNPYSICLFATLGLLVGCMKEKHVKTTKGPKK